MALSTLFKSVNIKRGIISGAILGAVLSFVIILVTMLLTRFARDIFDLNLLMKESANSLFMILTLLLMGFIPGVGYALAAANIDQFFKPADKKIVREIYDDDDLELQKEYDDKVEKKKRRILQKIFTFDIALFTAIVVLLITSLLLALPN